MWLENRRENINMSKPEHPSKFFVLSVSPVKRASVIPYFCWCRTFPLSWIENVRACYRLSGTGEIGRRAGILLCCILFRRSGPLAYAWNSFVPQNLLSLKLCDNIWLGTLTSVHTLICISLNHYSQVTVNSRSLGGKRVGGTDPKALLWASDCTNGF